MSMAQYPQSPPVTTPYGGPQGTQSPPANYPYYNPQPQQGGLQTNGPSPYRDMRNTYRPQTPQETPTGPTTGVALNGRQQGPAAAQQGPLANSSAAANAAASSSSGSQVGNPNQTPSPNQSSVNTGVALGAINGSIGGGATVGGTTVGGIKIGGSIVGGTTIGGTAISSSQSSQSLTHSESFTHEQTSVITQSTQHLGNILSEVPWMKFRVIAEPDMTLFASDQRLQTFVAQITQTTVNVVSEQIMVEFQTSITQLLQSITQTINTRMSSVRDTVIQQISSMSSIQGVSGATVFQPLILNPGLGISADQFGNGNPVKPGQFPIIGQNGNGFVTPIIDPPNPECPRLFFDQTPVILAPPDITMAQWIWTKEVATNATPNQSVRPFRKVIDLKCPVNYATIDISCDNFYTVYINGRVVGSGKDWNKPDRYTVRFAQTTKVVIAVYGAQDPVSIAQVGLIAAVKVWHSQEESPQPTSVVTDASWKTVSTDNFSTDYIYPNYDDQSWEQALVEAPYGGGVWQPIAPVAAGTLPKVGLSNIPGGVPDAPKAGVADVQ